MTCQSLRLLGHAVSNLWQLKGLQRAVVSFLVTSLSTLPGIKLGKHLKENFQFLRSAGLVLVVQGDKLLRDAVGTSFFDQPPPLPTSIEGAVPTAEFSRATTKERETLNVSLLPILFPVPAIYLDDFLFLHQCPERLKREMSLAKSLPQNKLKGIKKDCRSLMLCKTSESSQTGSHCGKNGGSRAGCRRVPRQ